MALKENKKKITTYTQNNTFWPRLDGVKNFEKKGH